jgi:hypothetical protein
MRLTVGTIELGSETSNTIQLLDGETLVLEVPLSALTRPRMGKLSPHLPAVKELVVGYAGLGDIDFIRLLPNVSSVWIMTPTVKSIEGLQSVKHSLRSLRIDRPTCRMDVLGVLESLEDVYIDGWRPGAHSIFELKMLVSVGIQKYGRADLRDALNWSSLSELWLNAGKLENLSGIPTGVKRVELSNLRKLESLSSLSTCRQLEELILQGCKRVSSLSGLDSCTELRLLSISRGGELDTLEPLRGLDKLEYIVLAGGTQVREGELEALYSLPSLCKLIVSKRTGLDRDRIKSVAPDCDIVLAN